MGEVEGGKVVGRETLARNCSQAICAKKQSPSDQVKKDLRVRRRACAKRWVLSSTKKEVVKLRKACSISMVGFTVDKAPGPVDSGFKIEE